MIAIDDPHLPGLSDLSPERLCDVTGAESVDLLRLRYRPGKRAILHVGTGGGQAGQEGTVWFFRGDKARRIARRHATARYDETTQAVFEPFPNDHRMPQIRTFLDSYRTIVPALTDRRPIGPPVLLRYRPGLSCTFRCGTAGRDPVYIKLLNDDDPRRIALMNRRVGELLAHEPVSVAAVTGTHEAVSAIGYAGARGRPLDKELAASPSVDPVLQTLDALGRFWRMAVTPPRHFDRRALFERAAESALMVNVMSPASKPLMDAILTRLDGHSPALGCRPIHGDMKLEHVFLDGGRTTLIDTESLSLGPPDYDLAQLYGRLWQAEFEGLLPEAQAASAAGEVRRVAGPGFGWCLDVVALRLAKFYAQRPGPDTGTSIAALLERLR